MSVTRKLSQSRKACYTDVEPREKASEDITRCTVSIEVVQVNKAGKISARNLLGNYLASWLKQANKNGGRSKQILSYNSS